MRPDDGFDQRLDQVHGSGDPVRPQMRHIVGRQMVFGWGQMPGIGRPHGHRIPAPDEEGDGVRATHRNRQWRQPGPLRARREVLQHRVQPGRRRHRHDLPLLEPEELAVGEAIGRQHHGVAAVPPTRHRAAERIRAAEARLFGARGHKHELHALGPGVQQASSQQKAPGDPREVVIGPGHHGVPQHDVQIHQGGHCGRHGEEPPHQVPCGPGGGVRRLRTQGAQRVQGREQQPGTHHQLHRLDPRSRTGAEALHEGRLEEQPCKRRVDVRDQDNPQPPRAQRGQGGEDIARDLGWQQATKPRAGPKGLRRVRGGHQGLDRRRKPRPPAEPHRGHSRHTKMKQKIGIEVAAETEHLPLRGHTELRPGVFHHLLGHPLVHRGALPARASGDHRSDPVPCPGILLCCCPTGPG